MYANTTYSATSISSIFIRIHTYFFFGNNSRNNYDRNLRISTVNSRIYDSRNVIYSFLTRTRYRNWLVPISVFDDYKNIPGHDVKILHGHVIGKEKTDRDDVSCRGTQAVYVYIFIRACVHYTHLAR